MYALPPLFSSCIDALTRWPRYWKHNKTSVPEACVRHPAIFTLDVILIRKWWTFWKWLTIKTIDVEWSEKIHFWLRKACNSDYQHVFCFFWKHVHIQPDMCQKKETANYGITFVQFNSLDELFYRNLKIKKRIKLRSEVDTNCALLTSPLPSKSINLNAVQNSRTPPRRWIQNKYMLTDTSHVCKRQLRPNDVCCYLKKLRP